MHRGSSWNSVLSVIFIYHNVTSNSIKIGSLLGSGCPSGRDNTDAVFLVMIAVAHNAKLLRFDRSNNEEMFFLDGVIRIVKQDSELAVKDLLLSLKISHVSFG